MSEHQHGTQARPRCGVSDEQELGADFWNERYASAPAIWSRQPNPQLVAEASRLSPGRALDVGAGEGADAIWLAAQGWAVTAVDISSVALTRAAEHARAAGDDVVRGSASRSGTSPPGTPRRLFDLVSAQFVHVPPARRDA